MRQDLMDNLKQYINGQPDKTKSYWAGIFGISRPYLYDLMDGKREPSLEVAKRIEAETSGVVPVSSWANYQRVIAAVSGEVTQ